MVLLLWTCSVVVLSIQMDLMLVLVTFDWLTVLCGVMCKEVVCVREWFVVGWVHFLWVVDCGFV